MENESPGPESGSVVFDLVSERVGTYEAETNGKLLLRPVGGGVEWEAEPGFVRSATPSERMKAQVKAVNRRTGKSG